MAQRFDAGYYRRFYGRRPVHNLRHIAHLGEGVISLASWWRIPIRSVLDVGAGRGYWRDWLVETHPTVKYHGIDASEYACRRYQHELADLAVWEPRRRYDLVVCQSVIQYVHDKDAARAIAMLGLACRGLLLFETPTVRDRDTVIDPSSTDLDVHWRTGDWYRKRLMLGFTEIGGGLWLSRECTAVFFELERARITPPKHGA
ncbi:MAG: class I SAM-dependent methyltransferase [Ilumatobacteraceae bacterium]|nr:class I SAM-dependent methyltransferase [Ilumatobacteraceae bacterium]